MTKSPTGPLPRPPYTDDVVMALPLDRARQELLEDIMTTPTLHAARPPAQPADKPRRTRWLVVVASAAAAAVVITAPAWWAQRGGEEAISPYAPSAISAAQESTRVLVDAPGWKITYVYGFGTAEGEMTFRNGDQELEVHWRSAENYDDYLQDRAHVSSGTPVELLGKASTMFTYVEGDYATIRPVEGDSFLEVRGGVGDRSAYLAVLAQLVLTDVDTWLAAMPPEVVVMPSERAETIQEMLEGIRTPPGFDIGAIPADELGDRYHFGARVTGTVTCAWVERWQQSTRAGNEAEAAEAVAALQSSKDWPILLDMNDQGDYPEVLWEIADKVSAGHFPVGYKQGLGCD
jgi:hypothetical protein